MPWAGVSPTSCNCTLVIPPPPSHCKVAMFSMLWSNIPWYISWHLYFECALMILLPWDHSISCLHDICLLHFLFHFVNDISNEYSSGTFGFKNVPWPYVIRCHYSSPKMRSMRFCIQRIIIIQMNNRKWLVNVRIRSWPIETFIVTLVPDDRKFVKAHKHYTVKWSPGW